MDKIVFYIRTVVTILEEMSRGGLDSLRIVIIAPDIKTVRQNKTMNRLKYISLRCLQDME